MEFQSGRVSTAGGQTQKQWSTTKWERSLGGFYFAFLLLAPLQRFRDPLINEVGTLPMQGRDLVLHSEPSCTHMNYAEIRNSPRCHFLHVAKRCAVHT